jgi:hypothetical protein
MEVRRLLGEVELSLTLGLKGLEFRLAFGCHNEMVKSML